MWRQASIRSVRYEQGCSQRKMTLQIKPTKGKKGELKLYNHRTILEGSVPGQGGLGRRAEKREVYRFYGSDKQGVFYNGWMSADRYGDVSGTVYPGRDLRELHLAALDLDKKLRAPLRSSGDIKTVSQLAVVPDEQITFWLLSGNEPTSHNIMIAVDQAKVVYERLQAFGYRNERTAFPQQQIMDALDAQLLRAS